MIADIQKVESFTTAVQYHERKCDSGVGELLFNSTLENSSSGYVKALSDTVKLNPNITVNKGSHISISLPPQENLTNEKFTDLAHTYMDKLGYSDCPMLIYRNYDSSKEHIHIITSNVDFAGEKIHDGFERYRSQEISRQLEKDLNLQVTQYSDNKKQTLAEINGEKFKYQNGIKSAVEDPRLSANIASLIKPATLQKILSRPLANDDLSLLLDQQKDSVYQLLSQNDLLFTSKKSLLSDRLELLYNKSATREDFIARIHKEGLYARILIKKRQPYLVYGTKEDNFYLHEKTLPQKFRYSNLQNIRSDKTVSTGQRSSREQRSFLYKNINRALRHATSLEHLVNSLQANGIQTEVHRNAGGVYGLSFKSLNVNNPETFKATQVHRSLSWNKIDETLRANFDRTPDLSQRSEDAKTTLKRSTENLHLTLPPGSRSFKEEDQPKNKKKKKKRKRGRGGSGST